MVDSPCRILVMASGNGSNFQALCDGISDGRIPNATIIRLIVNRGKAYATTRAESKGIPWEYFNLISHGFQDKGEKVPQRIHEARGNYDAALAAKILEHKPHLVVLAGWMQIFGERFLDPLTAQGIRIINLHPALPGAYDGANAIGRAYDDFQKGTLKDNKTGIMVHNVIKEVDQGDPVLTREIECRPGESLAELEERIHDHEHELIVQATAKVVGEILGKGNDGK